jgi:triacylglycerol esterase/lipase EstA (alpha/beta hydrolase family)
METLNPLGGNMVHSVRILFVGLVLGLLAACGTDADLVEKPQALGNFKMEHNIVVSKNAKQGPLSRPANLSAFKSTLEGAIQDRMGRYEGDMLYHIGVNIDAYVLALPGVPVVLNPKSLLIFSVTVLDYASQNKINVEAEQITVLENLTGKTAISSGLTQSAEEQMENLSRSAARAIEKWLRENKAWFTKEQNAKRKAAGAFVAPTN